MKAKIKYRLKVVMVISYMIFIYLFSEYKFIIPTGEGEGVGFDPFPFYHVCEFGLLSLLLMYAFFKKIDISIIFGISILYCFLDELHQYFVPHRYFDISDIFHNIVGSTLGIIGYFVLMLIYFFIITKIMRRY